MSKLESGKGKELKDESRGSRLFDEEDGGAGAKRGGDDDNNNDNKNSDNRRGVLTTSPAIERAAQRWRGGQARQRAWTALRCLLLVC